jgi:ribonucleotide reductase beta subunit family protein with ferritin-like domain
MYIKRFKPNFNDTKNAGKIYKNVQFKSFLLNRIKLISSLYNIISFGTNHASFFFACTLLYLTIDAFNFYISRKITRKSK